MENTIYYIYHIKGRKIGCTKNIELRIKRQLKEGEQWEILEQHTDIYIASQREIELQKEYGYKVDFALYKYSGDVNKNSCAGKVGGKNNYLKGNLDKIRTFETCSKGGKIGGKISGKKNVESGHLNRIRNIESIKKAAKITGKNAVLSGQLDQARNIMINKRSKKIDCFDLDNNYIKTFNSINEASRELNLRVGNISHVLKGNRKKTGKYVFKYVN